jgi:hypothetical protein
MLAQPKIINRKSVAGFVISINSERISNRKEVEKSIKKAINIEFVNCPNHFWELSKLPLKPWLPIAWNDFLIFLNIELNI